MAAAATSLTIGDMTPFIADLIAREHIARAMEAAERRRQLPARRWRRRRVRTTDPA
jgi:hypothetical protein